MYLPVRTIDSPMITTRNYRLLLIIASIRNQATGRFCAGNDTDS